MASGAQLIRPLRVIVETDVGEEDSGPGFGELRNEAYPLEIGTRILRDIVRLGYSILHCMERGGRAAQEKFHITEGVQICELVVNSLHLCTG